MLGKMQGKVLAIVSVGGQQVHGNVPIQYIIPPRNVKVSGKQALTLLDST